MYVIKDKVTGRYVRYACKYDHGTGKADDLTDDLNNAKTYNSLRSCQNSSAWKLDRYEFVEVEIVLKSSTPKEVK